MNALRFLAFVNDGVRQMHQVRQNVTLEVNDASLGYLLDTTLKPLGLTYRISEDVLEIIESP